VNQAEEINERIIIAFFLGMEGGTKRHYWDAYNLYMAYNGTLDFSGCEPITGKDAILDALFPDPDSDDGVVRVVSRSTNMLASGNFVFTERLDKHFDKSGNELASVKVSGVFDMSAGKIKRLSDYGDMRSIADVYGLKMTG
jgi:limonene-1,2-epoxide hydrolase